MNFKESGFPRDRLREKLHLTIANCVPPHDFLSVEDIDALGILGKAAKMNLSNYRRHKRGPKFLRKYGQYVYPRQEFIDWLFTTKVKVCE